MLYLVVRVIKFQTDQVPYILLQQKLERLILLGNTEFVGWS